jgi:peptidoglycan/LPS O-acetylase OafA/YrhL
MTNNRMTYRPDIDGLRAVAVLGVLAFHFQWSLISGGYAGVDVFYVISGFLISGILWEEFKSAGRIDFVRFWSRRFRRLLPMALTVIVVTLIALKLVGDNYDLRLAGRDASYAVAYITNWWEMAKGNDYFVGDDSASYFVHYWSLAVEEQYYALMTVVFAVLAAVGSVIKADRRARFLLTLVVVVGILSFASNLYFTYKSQPLGFFGTQNRLWQFCIGILVMAALRAKRGPRSGFVANGMMAVGLIAVAVAYLWFDGESLYPGWPALVPSFAAAAIIYGGSYDGDGLYSLRRLLSTPVFQYLGKISYSLYLWHWGVWMFLQQYDGAGTFKPWIALAVSIALSVPSYHFIETPLRFSGWMQMGRFRTFLVAAAAMVAGLAIAEGAVSFSGKRSHVIVLESGKKVNIEMVRNERPITYLSKPRCHIEQSTVKYPPCIFGDTASTRSIVLFGDSHAAHWFPALEELAKAHHFKLLSRTKSACSPIEFKTYNSTFKREYAECDAWREAVVSEIEKIHPELVVMGSSRTHTPVELHDKPAASPTVRLDLLKSKVLQNLPRLSAAAGQVDMMYDTPWFKTIPVECIAKGGTAKSCGLPEDVAVSGSFPWLAQGDITQSNVHIVSMNDIFCKDAWCVPASPTTVMFHDRHHLVASFSATLSEKLYERLGLGETPAP